MTQSPRPLDSQVAHIARVYDYWLGGKDNFDGLELLEPGVVRVPDWRPRNDADRANPAAVWGGVARKA